MKKKLAIFASGSGSNALAIIQYFKDNEEVEVALIVTNRSKSGVLKHAADHHIESMVIDKALFNSEKEFIEELVLRGIDLIVLAGFLWLIPASLVLAYPNRIINIHPSLLPKYGGKGMYGIHVHKAVKESGDRQSGITIHLVNHEYDKGRKLFQETVDLDPEDTPEMIARKVLNIEHKYYPQVIDNYLKRLV